jgi:hypothetical protein
VTAHTTWADPTIQRQHAAATTVDPGENLEPGKRIRRKKTIDDRD